MPEITTDNSPTEDTVWDDQTEGDKLAVKMYERMFEAIVIQMSPLYFTERISAEQLIKSADKLSNLAANHICPA
jgi:hypothetical protein